MYCKCMCLTSYMYMCIHVQCIHAHVHVLGFGKGTLPVYKMLWVDGIDLDMLESSLERTTLYDQVWQGMQCTYMYIQVYMYF